MDMTGQSPASGASGLFGIVLTQPEQQSVSLKLWELLKFQSIRYSAGDHSSIPEETARELLKSIMFTLEYILSRKPDRKDLLVNADFRELLAQGSALLEGEIEKASRLYQRVLNTRPRIESEDYNFTINGLAEFFGCYDCRYFAHRVPCDIDYPLAVPVDEDLEGVVFYNHYLQNLLTENLILSSFAPDLVHLLLKKSSPGYEELLINLTEPVMQNSLGLAIAGRDVLTLSVSSSECKRIQQRLRGLITQELGETLSSAAEEVCAQLKADVSTEIYFKAAAQRLMPRLIAALHHDNLPCVFIEI